MLAKKTVFILGAGASFELNLPIGSKLRELISLKLKFETDDFGRLKPSSGDEISKRIRAQHSLQLREYFEAARFISSGVLLTDSIDDFIHNHEHDERIAFCGKLAIAESILQAENSSLLAYRNNHDRATINFNGLEKTWYPAFYKLITQGLTKSTLDAIFDNVEIISFNYDRCIEHYFTHALVTLYGISKDQAVELVSGLVIHRPYGAVGNYFGINKTAFGGILPSNDVIQKTIRTYTEKTDDVESLTKMRQAIYSSKTLVFLGMAYHPNNMRLLFNEQWEQPLIGKNIFATRAGIREPDLMAVKQSLLKFAGLTLNNVHAADYIKFSQTCFDLFNDYHRTLRA